jgi:hypothetical protein
LIAKEEACHPKLHGSKVARFFGSTEVKRSAVRTARLSVSVVLAEDLALSIHTWYLLQAAARAAACCLLVDSLKPG